MLSKIQKKIRDEIILDAWEKYRSEISMKELWETFISIKTFFSFYRIIRNKRSEKNKPDDIYS